MAQNPPQRCPRCGTPAEAGQRFCAECGAVLSSEGNKPTELASGNAFRLGNVPGAPQGRGDVLPLTVPTSGAQFYQEGTEPNVIPPPPPADSYIARPQSMASQMPAPAPVPVQTPGSYTVPDYAKAPRRSRGCLIVSILLLLVLVAGALGIYFGFFH